MSKLVRDAAAASFYCQKLQKRTRPPAVAEELRWLEGLSRSAVLRKVEEVDKSRRLSKEALVSILRHYLRESDKDSADTVFMALITQLSGAVANKMRRWRSIPDRMAEDTRQTVILGLYEYIYSLEPGEELWECNFKTCFDMRMVTILAKIANSREYHLSVSQLSDADADESRFEAPDPAAESDFQRIEVVDALKHLDKIDSRLGKVFYLKFYVEMIEKEIADLMEVNERTVRNWIGLSKRELLHYFAEP